MLNSKILKDGKIKSGNLDGISPIVGIFKFNIVAKIVTKNRAIKAAGTIFVTLFGVKNIIKIVTKPTKSAS